MLEMDQEEEAVLSAKKKRFQTVRDLRRLALDVESQPRARSNSASQRDSHGNCTSRLILF